MDKKRVDRKPGELRLALNEQIALLEGDCKAFDGGLVIAAKRIAIGLRILLHDSKHSRSLLEMLGLRSISYADTAGPLNPNNVISESGLLSYRLSTESGMTYLARCNSGAAAVKVVRKLPFPEWWSSPVLKTLNGTYWCRRELVSHVANTDGGAHVDEAIDPDYAELSRNSGMGWVRLMPDGTEAVVAHPELPCIRQIAWEFLHSIYAHLQR